MTLPAYANNRVSFPEAYEHFLVPALFRPWADLLLDRVALAAGDRLLDVACGTGIIARVAKGRLGEGSRVVGVDVSPAMLAVARAVGPMVEWREGNAAALPAAAGESFDVVTCQQGLQFFPDRLAAAREMRRVLADGGRVVVATWRPLGETPLMRDLHEVAVRHAGPITDHRHAFGDGPALTALLEEAGFRAVRNEVATLTAHFDDGAAFLKLNTMALVGMSAGAKDLDDEGRARVGAAIEADSAEVLRRHSGGSALAFEMSTNVATGRR